MKDVSNAERLKLLEHNAHLPIYEHRDIVVRAGRQNAESVLSLKRKKRISKRLTRAERREINQAWNERTCCSHWGNPRFSKPGWEKTEKMRWN